MHFSTYISPIGFFDGTQEAFSESIYLLTEGYRIIGMRPATHAQDQASVTHVGDAFFKRFPASKEERGVLERQRRALTDKPLLMRAGNRPVLMLCSFFARTKLLVAILPEGQVREALDAPGAYADALDWLYFSPETQLRRRSPDEHAYACIAYWLSTIKPAISPDDRGYLTSTGIVGWLSRLTDLCGCRLSYDLEALAFKALPETSAACLAGTLFASLLTAYGEAQKRTLHLAAKYDTDLDYLLFEIIWKHREPRAQPAFCEVLAEEASVRGAFFAMYVSPHDNTDFCIRFSPTLRELSKQQIKALTEQPIYWDFVIVEKATAPDPHAAPKGTGQQP